MGKRCEEVCAFCGHLDKGHCDIHNSNPIYPDNDHGCTYWQAKSEITYQRCGNCNGFIFTTPAKTWGICEIAHSRRDIHSNTFTCDLFYKEGEEDMPKQTYYTKCGREFQKNSTAEVTGYTLGLNEFGSGVLRDSMESAFSACITCPFKVEVTEGYPNKKHVRWECRAGTKKPNHTTEWTGSLEDKNTIQIHSLDYQLMEEIKEFCENHSDLGAGYNADHMADCRRTLAINCSSNKKGIAAKKALIEKFFPAVETVPEEDKQMKKHCVDCVSCQKSGKGEGHPFQHKCFNAAHRTGLEFYFPDNCEACGNFEQKEEEIPMNENACLYGVKDCPCFNADLNTCDAIRRKDWDRFYYIKEMQKYNIVCDIFVKLAAQIIAEKKPEKAETLEPVEITTNIAVFDYSTVDTETADFLQDKAEKIATIRMKSVMAIGKELKEAQDKLASHNKYEGSFQKWVESLGITPRTAYNYINGFDYVVKNFHNIDSADQIQPSLLFAVSKPSAPAELQQAVLSGDIKTNKEYQEALEELKATKEALAQAEFHYKTVDESYKRLEKTNTEHYQKRVQAEQEIENYQQEIGHLNQQLNSKPLEVQATTIKEVVPAEVQAELQRLTTENRLLSEQQTSTSKAIDFIIQGAARSEAELKAYIAIAKSEIPKFNEIPPAVKDTVYQSLSALKCFVLDLENVTRQFKE